MAYTVLQLISEAYDLSGVVARDFQIVSGSQISSGLSLLNSSLSIKTADPGMIPYYKQYDLTSVIGQKEYFIPGLVEAATFVYFINNVRFASNYVPRNVYHGSPRVDQVNALPFNYNFERVKGGSTLSVYFPVSQEYPFQIFGKFGLESVTLMQDLSLTYEKFYIYYMKCLLAQYICANYNITMPPQTANQLRESETAIRNMAPPDLTVNKSSTFSSSNNLTWAQVNLGGGYTPWGGG